MQFSFLSAHYIDPVFFLYFRVEYDAYRADMETLQLAPKDATTQARLHESRIKYEKQKEKFDKLRQDVAVKLRFLEENKVSRLVNSYTGSLQQWLHT